MRWKAPLVNKKKLLKKLIIFPSFELVSSWIFASCNNSRKKIVDIYKELMLSEIDLGVHHAKFPTVAWEILHAYPESSVLNASASVQSYDLDSYLALNRACLPMLPADTNNPLSLLISSACEKEIIIFVPPNTQLDMPLEYLTNISNNQRLFEKIYFIIGARSKVTIIDTLKSIEAHNYAFVGRRVTCIVEENAQLDYIFLNYCGESVTLATSLTVVAKKNAQATIFCGSVGGSVSIIDMMLNCDEERAEINNSTLYALSNTQELSLATHQVHSAPTTKSHVQIKGIVRDYAYSNYDGNVTITNGAPHTSAHQESAILLLSPQAKARATPALEVKTQEVQCSHGSAVGIINSEYYIYLQARGIEQARAQQMILEGFAASLLGTVKEPTLNILGLKELQRRCYGQ